MNKNVTWKIDRKANKTPRRISRILANLLIASISLGIFAEVMQNKSNDEKMK